MPTISEYTPEIQSLIPKYKETNYDVGLDIAILQKKQREYDTAFAKIKGLESRALNIQMLNQEGRQRLDAYNKRLESQLSKDLGDLSRVEVQNKVASMFQDIAQDTQLIRAATMSRQYQDQVDLINSFKQSGRKDKGYNSINETVFMDWDGGYNDFVNKSLADVTSGNFAPIKYVPFKELDTKMLNIAKTLHQDTIKRQTATGNGYLRYVEQSGVSPERISELMQTQFDQEDLEQLDQMAKYEVIRARKLNSVPALYNKYDVYSKNEIKRVQSEQSKYNQQADYLEKKLKGKLEEGEAEEITQMVAQLRANAEILGQREFDLQNSKKSLGDFQNMSNDELAEYAKEMQWSQKIKGVSDAMSWKTDVDMYKTDPTYLGLKKLDTIRWQEQLRANTRLTLDRLKEEKAKKEKGPEWGGVGDPVKNKQDIYTSFGNLVGLQEQMAKQTNRLIDSQTFDPRQLSDQGFLKANADNYHVKMWDVFSKQYPAFQGGQPQTEAFRLWLKEQEENPSTPFIQGVVEQQRRDEFVSDYIDDKVDSINKATREKLNEYDMLSNYTIRHADGTPMTKDQYNSGRVAYISVPTDANKTGYKLIKLDDAVSSARTYRDTSKEHSRDLGNPFKPPLAVANLEPTKPLVYNDKGLYNTLIDVSESRSNADTMIRDILTERLPQIGQFGMMQSLNKEAIQSKIGDVMGAAKNSDPDKQFGIGVDDLEFVNVPVGSGQFGQFKLKDSAAKTYAEEGWQLPLASDPHTFTPIVPGNTYAFKTQPVSPYDTYFNLILEERPWVDYYKGYKIEMSKSPVNKNVIFLNIFDPKGLPIKSEQVPSQGESKNYLEAIKRVIDGL